MKLFHYFWIISEIKYFLIFNSHLLIDITNGIVYSSIISPILLLYRDYKPARGLFIDSGNVVHGATLTLYIYRYVNRRIYPNGQIYRINESFNSPTWLYIYRCQIKFAYNWLRSSCRDIFYGLRRKLVTRPRAFQQCRSCTLEDSPFWLNGSRALSGDFQTSTRSAFGLTFPARYYIFRRCVRSSFTLLPFSAISRISRMALFLPMCSYAAVCLAVPINRNAMRNGGTKREREEKKVKGNIQPLRRAIVHCFSVDWITSTAPSRFYHRRVSRSMIFQMCPINRQKYGY